jgi:hypothetical protein
MAKERPCGRLEAGVFVDQRALPVWCSISTFRSSLVLSILHSYRCSTLSAGPMGQQIFNSADADEFNGVFAVLDWLVHELVGAFHHSVSECKITSKAT